MDLKKQQPSKALQDMEAQWEQHNRSSVLKETQRIRPDRWQQFYDAVADGWEEMNGLSGLVGSEIARFITKHRLVYPGKRILEVGCGPGETALALARQGLAVTALDSSSGMIQALETKLHRSGVKTVQTCLADWKHYVPDKDHEMALACFFPDAFSPGGLHRMEALTSAWCCLVLGDGTETFPLRKTIWDKVMPKAPPEGDFHFTFAAKYLTLARRNPFAEDVSLPARLDVDYQRAASYFKAYFAIFDKSGKTVHQAISDALAPFMDNGSIRMSGTVNMHFLFWHKHLSAPICTGAAR